MQNTVIYLIGFAGTGKYTVAKELSKLNDFKIVHNHLVNDTVFDVLQKFEEDIPEYVWKQISKVRNVVFNTIENYADKKLNYIFTNELVKQRKSDVVLYKKVEKLALKRNSKFYPVRLIIDSEEHKKRITAHERKLSNKISNVDYVESLRGVELIEPKNKNLFDINVSNLSATDSAKNIMKKIEEF